MKFRVLQALALVTCLTMGWPGTARGQKLQIRVSPKNATEAGFTVSFRPGRQQNTVTVSVVRDTAKSQPVNSADLMLRRSATLRLYGDAGLLLECPVQPRDEHGRLVFEFTLAQSLLGHAHLSVAEIEDYKAPGREHLLGGGTFYELPLAEFPGRPGTP